MRTAVNQVWRPWVEVVVISTSALLVYFLVFGAQFVFKRWVPGGDTQNLWSLYYLAIYSLRHFHEIMWWDPTALNGWPAYYLMYFGWGSLLSPFQLAQIAGGALLSLFTDLSINRYLVLQKTLFVIAINIVGITLISRELVASRPARFLAPLVYAVCGMQFMGFVAGPTSDALPAAIFLLYGLILFNTRRTPGSLVVLILFIGIYAGSINYMTLQTHIYPLALFSLLMFLLFPGFFAAIWFNTRLLAKSRWGLACLVVGLLLIVSGLLVFWGGVKPHLSNIPRLLSGSVPYDINAGNQFGPPNYAIAAAEAWTAVFYWIPYSDFHAFTLKFDPYTSGHEYRYIGLATLPLMAIALISGQRNRYTLCFSMAFFLCVAFFAATVENLPLSLLIDSSDVFKNIRTIALVMPRDLVSLFPLFAAAIGLDAIYSRHLTSDRVLRDRGVLIGTLTVLALVAATCLFLMATVPSLAPVRKSLGHIGVYLLIIAVLLVAMVQARDTSTVRALAGMLIGVAMVDLVISASDQWKNNNGPGRYHHDKSAIYMRAEDAGIHPIESEAASWPGNYFQGVAHNVHLGGPHFGLRYWLVLATRRAWQPVLDGWNPVTRMVTKYPNFKFFTNGVFIPESAIRSIDNVQPPASEPPPRILEDEQGRYVRYDGRRYSIAMSASGGVVAKAAKSEAWPDRHVLSGWAIDDAGKPARLVLVFIDDEIWYVGSPNQQGVPSGGEKVDPDSRFILEVPLLPKQASEKARSVRVFALTKDQRALELDYAKDFPFQTAPLKKYAREHNTAPAGAGAVPFYLHDMAVVKPGMHGRRLYEAKWEVLEFTLNRVKVRVELPEPAFMIYLDNFDRYWNAYLNGAPASIHRANFTFKAVQVPAGSSVVEWVYSPSRLKIAWGFYYALLVGFISLLVFFSRRARG